MDYYKAILERNYNSCDVVIYTRHINLYKITNT